MADDWDKLEREVASGIDALSKQLELRAPYEVVERARVAAHVALDERLLEHPEVFIPQALRKHLRDAIRQELGGGSRSDRWSAWWRRHGCGLSALASAAMIAVCFGVIRYAGNIVRHTSGDPLERFVQAGAEVYRSDPFTAGLEDAVRDLDERIVEGPAESDRVEESLQQLEEMMDSLQRDIKNDNG